MSFVDDSHESELLNDRWEAVQRHWLEVEHLLSLEVHDDFQNLEEILSTASSAVTEGDGLPEGCARDLMKVWVESEERILHILDRNALQLFKCDQSYAPSALLEAKRQRTCIKRFTKELKDFLVQERKWECVMEFLQDQERAVKVDMKVGR